MKKELNLFKAGIIWAIFSSLIMLIGAAIYGEFPQILEALSNKGKSLMVFASVLYVVANFIIFTIPALLVYKAGGILNNTEKFVWISSNTFLTNIGLFLKHAWKLIKRFSLTAFVFLILYMIGATLRGDIFAPGGTKITDYGYFVGVIITALFFGFRDLKDVQDTQQKHDGELKKIKKDYSKLEKKFKKMEERYTRLRNKGKQQLALLEKEFQVEDSQKEVSVPEKNKN